MKKDLKYSRILLKVSGEALMGTGDFGIEQSVVDEVSTSIAEVVKAGTGVVIVIGGGNIFRGVAMAAQGMDRPVADHVGMLATVMNGLALQAGLRRAGVGSRVLSALAMPGVCEHYVRGRALSHLDKGRVVICVAGTGNPFFTTDTAAALRASELDCDALLKGTQVDGVYDADPKTNPDARRYDHLNYAQVLSKDLKIMDAAAIVLARDNAIPILVFSLRAPDALIGVLKGEGNFTVVGEAVS